MAPGTASADREGIDTMRIGTPSLNAGEALGLRPSELLTLRQVIDEINEGRCDQPVELCPNPHCGEYPIGEVYHEAPHVGGTYRRCEYCGWPLDGDV